MKKKTTLFVVASVSLAVIAFAGFQSMDKNPSVQDSGQVIIEMDATFPNFSTDVVAKKASLIVKGKPVKVVKTFSEGENNPITEFSFKIDEVYKGSKSNEEYISVFQDGAPNNDYDTHPIMELNTEYVLFLEEPLEAQYTMVGGPSGKFEFDATKKSFVSFTNREVPQAQLKSLSVAEE